MALMAGGVANEACAQPFDAGIAPSVEDLQRLSIDELANIQITSAAKHPQALGAVAASIFIITADDIRRSGALSLPEVLRLAPNLEVARLNAYSWTVTARGFNSPETANKLLVMINGRSVYEPIGGGILWQQVDVNLANIDRIEVIAGPGGTMWGANAVNGVVNVITKPSAQTQGLYASATAGSFQRAATVRYSGRLSEHVTFKLMGNSFDTDRTKPVAPDDLSNDAFHGAFGSLSVTGDWDGNNLSAGVMTYNNQVADNVATFTGTMGRLTWNHDLTGGGGISVNAVISRDVREETTLYESRDSITAAAQHSFRAGPHHNIIWGGEFRYWWEDFESFNDFQFADPKTNISLGSLFAQDEISIRSDLTLTVGLKAEYNSYSGIEWLPNVRLAWQRSDGSLIWGAISRAARTPNRIERELTHPLFLQTSPDFSSEKVTAYELGWRAQPMERLSLSLSSFYNQYDDLRTDTYPVTIFPLILQNGGEGETYGIEGWGKYEVMPGWRLSAGFNLLHKKFRLKPGFNDLSNLAVQGQDPAYQAQIGSQWAITPAVDLSVTLRQIGEVDNAPVPAYTEANASVTWRLTDRLALSLEGLNLLHKHHLEVYDPSTLPARYIPRSISVRLRYGL
jgi:iron complex outermembrane receptor protein